VFKNAVLAAEVIYVKLNGTMAMNGEYTRI